MSQADRISQLPSLVPASIRADEEVARIAQALQDLGAEHPTATGAPALWACIEQLGAGGPPFTDTERALLDQLAVEARADRYGGSAITDAERPAVVLDALRWNQRRGTPAAIEELLAAYGYDAYVYEGGPRWAVYRRAVYHFDDEAADEVALDSFPAATYYDPTLGPFAFGVVIDAPEAAGDRAEAEELIARAQNARSVLAYLRFNPDL